MHSAVGAAFGLGNNVVARSVSEIRRCAPIIIHQNNEYALVFSSELLDNVSFATLVSLPNEAYLLLTANRTRFLTRQCSLSRVYASNLTLEEVRLLLSGDAKGLGAEIVISDRSIDSSVIALMKFAKLLPSALVVDMDFKSHGEMVEWCTHNNILHLDGDALSKYQERFVLNEVCSSDLFLHESLASKILVYRSNIGEPEHYAIVVGTPDPRNPVVRLHSSCYTGDLLGSMSCDCRSQLLSTIDLLGNIRGGIILYISQEGRGIGLANKIRAYNLQAQNMLDTVDANRFLGFDDDERVFFPAAAILKKLGISEIQLLSNNPKKALGIQKCGITVTKMIPFSVGTNIHNYHYLKTKRERLGHVN